jgi:hypothetical protein
MFKSDPLQEMYTVLLRKDIFSWWCNSFWIYIYAIELKFSSVYIIEIWYINFTLSCVLTLWYYNT